MERPRSKCANLIHHKRAKAENIKTLFLRAFAPSRLRVRTECTSGQAAIGKNAFRFIELFVRLHSDVTRPLDASI
jgi:hypothetical protein